MILSVLKVAYPEPVSNAALALHLWPDAPLMRKAWSVKYRIRTLHRRLKDEGSTLTIATVTDANGSLAYRLIGVGGAAIDQWR